MINNSSYQSGFSTVALVIALGAAVILGVGAYFLTRSSSPSPTSPATKAESWTVRNEQTTAEELTGRELTTTIPDIIGRGQSLECDWKMPVAGENPFHTGKLWTTGSKGRSHVTANISGMAMEANAVYQGDAVYTWTMVGGQKMGMKFSPSKLEEMNSSMTPQQKQQAEQIRQSMIFNCKPWAADDTKFVLPQDIEFKEY